MLAKLLPELGRLLVTDEISLLSGQLDQPVGSRNAGAYSEHAGKSAFALKAIQDFPPGRGEFAKMISSGAKALLTREPSPANRRLVVHLARTQRLAELEPEVLAAVSEKEASGPDLIEAVKALRRGRQIWPRGCFSGSDPPRRRPAKRRAAPGSSHRTGERQKYGGRAGDCRALAAAFASSPPHRTRQDYFIQNAGLGVRQSASRGKRFHHGGSRRCLIGQARHSPRRGRCGCLRDSRWVERRDATRSQSRLNGSAGDIAETNLDLRGPFTVEIPGSSSMKGSQTKTRSWVRKKARTSTFTTAICACT